MVHIIATTIILINKFAIKSPKNKYCNGTTDIAFCSNVPFIASILIELLMLPSTKTAKLQKHIPAIPMILIHLPEQNNMIL